ncbi:flagellar hook-associated protein FlgK [Ornithinibacillus contaminans]|uniref:flagellar hook-associated protein FlgK n=1 Tax=Ornithinibacillus contaminans TaxID=694055 RepID=UPI00069F227E|nr:flagellar hook-associated protein FlgK [Ornithinibacillus contaminans]
MSTFHGLEMAKQALFTQQSALYTTGHNISNANTEGYTRQRVNFETTPAFPTGSRNRPQIPGQIGTGVQAGTVERIRDSFLDMQYRAENSKTGYWETMSESLYRMESLLNEPSESGLANTMDQFWQSLQDLSVDAQSESARSVVVQRGIAVADTFNYLSNNIESMQTDIRKQIDVTIDDANSILRQIDRINNQIKEIEPHGYLANDLYDERDRLIDKLSSIANIKVHRVESAESAQDIAAGLAKIELVDDSGKSFASGPVYLVDPTGEPTYQEFDLAEDAEVNEITFGGNTIDLSSGSLKSLVDAHGYPGSGDKVVSYENMKANLAKLAETFVSEFNSVHQEGYNYNGVQDTELKFFQIDENGNVTVSEEIQDDPALIAASSEEDASGNGENAGELAKVMDKLINGNPLGDGASIKGFYEGLIGRLGVAAQEANRMAQNTNILRSQVEEQRVSVSSVSLDEEMTNMLKFQHAYNAAARSMTATDEILDRIINNMGLVGR